MAHLGRVASRGGQYFRPRFLEHHKRARNGALNMRNMHICFAQSDTVRASMAPRDTVTTNANHIATAGLGARDE